MNYKIICALFFLLIFSISPIYSGGGDTTTQYVYHEVTTYQDITYASEDGHFNISFDNNYSGYCFEYGEQEAAKGDKFYVEATDYVLNTEGKDVSNLLKVYFVDYYNETQKDKIVTQHMIWHFTDNFEGRRVNQTLANNIRETAEYKKIPDTGVTRYNDTHNMFFDFRSFISPFEHHQNFFGYRIVFNPIKEQEDECQNETENITINNITNNYYNNITNNYYNIINNYYNNTTNNYYNIINNTTNNYYNIINNTTNNYYNITNNTTNNYYNITNNTTNNCYNITNNITNINIGNITIINNTTNQIDNQTNHTLYIIKIIIYKLYQPTLYHSSTAIFYQQKLTPSINFGNYDTGNPIFLLIIGFLMLLIGGSYYRYK